jgi:hypothetical protein
MVVMGVVVPVVEVAVVAVRVVDMTCVVLLNLCFEITYLIFQYFYFDQIAWKIFKFFLLSH